MGGEPRRPPRRTSTRQKQLGQLTQINAGEGAAVERQLLDRAAQSFAKRCDTRRARPLAPAHKSQLPVTMRAERRHEQQR